MRLTEWFRAKRHPAPEPEGSIPRLIRSLETGDVQAAHRLASAGPHVVRPLVGLLEHPTAQVRRLAVEVLASMGDRVDGAMSVLTFALEDEDPLVRDHALAGFLRAAHRESALG